jgi:hypothetical protein
MMIIIKGSIYCFRELTSTPWSSARTGSSCNVIHTVLITGLDKLASMGLATVVADEETLVSQLRSFYQRSTCLYLFGYVQDYTELNRTIAAAWKIRLYQKLVLVLVLDQGVDVTSQKKQRLPFMIIIIHKSKEGNNSRVQGWDSTNTYKNW